MQLIEHVYKKQQTLQILKYEGTFLCMMLKLFHFIAHLLVRNG